MNVLIIGYGAIGKERAKALLRLNKDMGTDDIKVYVRDLEPIENLPDGVFNVEDDTFKDEAPDWVFICTSHHVMRDWLSVVCTWGSKILVEKPFGRHYLESLDMYNMLPKPEDVYVGFNYRFFPAVALLARDLSEGRLGNIISMNMVLGHGGSPEDASSWKLDPILGARSALLDPGIHFLDLITLFFTEITPISYCATRGFWATGIDEEVHALLNGDYSIISIQASVVKWRSTFRIEVNGDDGYAIIEGKGKSYGDQIYTTGTRWGWKSTSLPQRETEEQSWCGDCSDSFYEETKSLLTHKATNCTASHALKVMSMYQEIIINDNN